jgi:hypothetical protein
VRFGLEQAEVTPLTVIADSVSEVVDISASD